VSLLFLDVAAPDVVATLKNPLLLSTFGGLISYLRTVQQLAKPIYPLLLHLIQLPCASSQSTPSTAQLKLDVDLLAQRQIRVYAPMDESASLLLDGQTLQNLEVLRNSTDGGTEGTLHALLNQAVSPFGMRRTVKSGRVANQAHANSFACIFAFLAKREALIPALVGAPAAPHARHQRAPGCHRRLKTAAGLARYDIVLAQ